jgi:hypothetical protein
MIDWITKAAVAAHWVVKRVGVGLMVMLAAASVVWIVFEICDSLSKAITTLTLMVAFLIGNRILGDKDKV